MVQWCGMEVYCKFTNRKVACFKNKPLARAVEKRSGPNPYSQLRMDYITATREVGLVNCLAQLVLGTVRKNSDDISAAVTLINGQLNTISDRRSIAREKNIN